MNNGTDWARYDNPGPQAGAPMGAPEPMAQQEQPVDRRTWFGRWMESQEVTMFRRRNRHTIVAMLVALFLIFMLINVGFGYTLLTIVFLAIAYIVGGWFDGNPRVYRLLQRFF